MANKILLYGGIALGGYLAYRWWQQNQVPAPPGTVPAPAPVSTLSNPTSIPQSGVIAPPAPTLSPHLQSWISRYLQGNPGLTGQMNYAINQLSPDDLSTLDQITTLFDNNQGLTGAQSQWWDAFITKYGLK